MATDKIREQMQAVALRRQREEPARLERADEESLKRLKKVIETRMMTAFIGGLDQFEKRFGHIWGRGMTQSGLSREERAFRELWQECRNVILDNGHAQVRSAMAELDLHRVSFRGFRRRFPVV